MDDLQTAVQREFSRKCSGTLFFSDAEWGYLREGWDAVEAIAWRVSGQALRVAGVPRDFARGVAYFCSDKLPEKSACEAFLKGYLFARTVISDRNGNGESRPSVTGFVGNEQ